MGRYNFTFWGFLIIYIAFFIKIPIYLFHVWLPKAHVEAPVYGSIVLAGVIKNRKIRINSINRDIV